MARRNEQRPGQAATHKSLRQEPGQATTAPLVAQPARAPLVGADHLIRQRKDGVPLEGVIVIEHVFRLANGEALFPAPDATLAVLRLPAVPLAGWITWPELDGLAAWLIVRTIPVTIASELADAMLAAGTRSVRIGRFTGGRLAVEGRCAGTLEVCS